MSTATMTLTEFLLARFAEDEAEAHRVMTLRRRFVDPRFITNRIERELEAKRRIVDWEQRYRTTVERRGESWEHRATGNLRALAAVYADHPDYRSEWAV